MRIARRSPRCRRTGAASTRVLGRIGISRCTHYCRPGQAKREPAPITTGFRFAKTESNNLVLWLWVPAFAGTTASMWIQRKWLLLRGAIFLCRPSVTVIALLDHDDAVTMVVTP